MLLRSFVLMFCRFLLHDLQVGLMLNGCAIDNVLPAMAMHADLLKGDIIVKVDNHAATTETVRGQGEGGPRTMTTGGGATSASASGSGSATARGTATATATAATGATTGTATGGGTEGGAADAVLAHGRLLARES